MRVYPQWIQHRLTLGTYLLVILAASVPRLMFLDRFLTVDEVNFWVARSGVFLNALRAGDALQTAISTHPGVTTMWSGAIGIWLRRPLFDAGLLPGLTVPGAIGLMRLPLALAHTAGVVLGYALLRRMLSGEAALLAALFWAFDPFVVAYSRLLHVDAPLTTFVTISLLAALRYWNGTRSRRSLVCSAIAGGLALLSKSPSLVLFPIIGLIAIWATLVPDRWESGTDKLPNGWRPLLSGLFAWGVIALLTMLLLWPALWVGPAKVYEQLQTGVTIEGAQPHILGNFFLGQPDDAPGSLFYPVTIALRLTPWTMVGLLALPFVWHHMQRATKRDLALLALYAIVFALALTFFPKKFNRYLLPIFPALDILAAVGFWQIIVVLARHQQRYRTAIRIAAQSVLVLLAALNIWWWQPYEIAAFNQLLGGAPAGARTFVIGWGEGFELVANWLNEQPNITSVSTVSRIPVVQNPYMRQGANAQTPLNGDLPPAAGYLVVYVSQTQRGDLSLPFNQFYPGRIPLHTISIHGVPYAWIYQVPPAVEQERAAQFGDQIELLGIKTAESAKPGGAMHVQLIWSVQMAPTTNYMLFAHLIGPDGARVAQADFSYPTSTWQAGAYPITDLQLALPVGLAPSDYRLLIGLYDPVSGQRLRLTSLLTADPSLSGDNALTLMTLTVR